MPFSNLASSRVLCCKADSSTKPKASRRKDPFSVKTSENKEKAVLDTSASSKSEIKELDLNEAAPGEKKKSIIDVIAPMIKSKESAEKEKVILENVKEQSLDGPQVLSADASQKVMEKMLEQKAEAGNCQHYKLFKRMYGTCF